LHSTQCLGTDVNRDASRRAQSPRQERSLIITEIAAVEPLLRASCTNEIDATRPVVDVADELAAIGG